MTEGGITEIKSQGQEKAICIFDFSEGDIENSPVISDFLSDSLLTLSRKDNLNQEENQLKELKNFNDDTKETHVLKKKGSTHISEYDSVCDKLAFTLESN